MGKYRIHYSWVILAVGITVVAGALGLGRFSYGMLLPSLQEGLKLTHDQTGYIASVNMAGYTLATLAVGGLVKRFGSRAVIFFSLFLVSLTMVAVGFAEGIIAVLVLRFFTGLGSAGAHISIMGLSSSWFLESRRGTANGILVGGSGLGIALSGLLVPFVLYIYPEQGWRYSWFLLGILVFLFGLLSFIFIKNGPQEKSLQPLGYQITATKESKIDDKIYTIKEIIKIKSIPVIASAFFCFGMSYLIYTTFFVNYLIGEIQVSSKFAGSIWSIVGFFSIGSTIIWGIISDKIGRPYALAGVFFLQVISYLLTATTVEVFYISLAAILFGLTGLSIPGIMASYCGDLLGSKNATTVLGFITLFFSLGSMLGPSFAGYIIELSNSFAAAFYLAAFLASLGCILSIMLARIRHRKTKRI